MPNWCFNELEIVSESQEEIEHVFKFIAGEGTLFDFNKVVPYPECFRKRDEDFSPLDRITDPEEHEALLQELEKKYGNRKDGYNSGGFEWRRDNWGTKWNAVRTRRFENRLFFKTAYVPPLPVIQELAKKFPKCDFHLEYFEHDQGFAGGVSFFGESDNSGEVGEPVNTWYTDDYRGNKGG